MGNIKLGINIKQDNNNKHCSFRTLLTSGVWKKSHSLDYTL